MRNKDFSKLSKLVGVCNTLKNVAIVITIIAAIIMFVGGIILCAYGEILTGLSTIIGSLILGGFGELAIYFWHLLVTAVIDAMSDIKLTGIAVDDMLNNHPEQEPLKLECKSYETSTCYLLRYIKKGSYLCSTSVEDRSLRVTKSVMGAIKFNSAQDAEKFADYKALSVGEQWDIVKKDLIIPIE